MMIVSLFLTFLFLKTACGRLSVTTRIGPQPLWNSTVTDKLRQDLLLNYDKFARPAHHYNVTTVRFGITIRHIEVNEFKSTLTVHSWLRLVWTDQKLKWNGSDYSGVEQLNLADHEIWQPDIFLYNSASSVATHYGTVQCIVFPNGDVLWVPPAQFTVLCALNLKYWPFDEQHCKLIFGSWTYSGDQLDLEENRNKDIELDLLVENSEWNIINTSMSKNIKYYDCCSQPYPDLTIEIILRRISPAYSALIVTPAIVIILIILTIFWLPPQSGEKITLSGCTAIIISLFMLYFMQKVPAMGTHVPLIVLFYSSSLYVVVFSLFSSIVVIWMARTRHVTSLPWFIKRGLTETLSKFLLLSSHFEQSSISSNQVTNEEMRDHHIDFEDHSNGDEHHMIKTNKISLQKDWILLAMVIDRLMFLLVGFVFMCLAIAYSL